ncbi:unnamed protein product, partial [Urochloa humidicola]
ANQGSTVSRAQSNPFKRFLDLFCVYYSQVALARRSLQTK